MTDYLLINCESAKKFIKSMINVKNIVGWDLSAQTQLDAKGGKIFFDEITNQIKEEYPEYTKAEEKNIYDLSAYKIKVKIINDDNKDNQEDINFSYIKSFNEKSKIIKIKNQNFKFNNILLIKKYDNKVNFDNEKDKNYLDKLLIKNFDKDYKKKCTM